jgi:thioredoxin-related protein
MGCIATKPAVDGLIAEWKDGQVLQLEMQSAASREFAATVNFRNTPSFFLFDRAGKLVKRWDRGVPTVAELNAAN